MKERAFEEQFPNLKGMGFGTRQEIVNKRLTYVRSFSSTDIQQHCLDKQKVREVIDNLKFPDRFGDTIEQIKERLKEKLGL